jgi:lycopene elongase/hydratase (flavuxanthin-forming)
VKLLKALFWSSRPISWINTAFPFAAGYVLISGSLDLKLLIGSLFFLIPYNLLMYGVNDVFDYESDMRNPRKGGIEGALLAPSYHLPVLLVSLHLPVPFVWYLIGAGNQVSNLVLAAVLFTVLAYSIKFLRFKEIPFLDSVTSAAHFVGPLVYGVALAGGNFNNPMLVMILVAFSLWGMASHAFGAVQDVKADREAGISSIATVLGARSTVWLAMIGYLSAGLVALFLGDRFSFAALAVIPYLFVVGREWDIDDQNCERANRGWRRFIWLNFFAGAVVSSLIIGPTW